jgi:hypothetical protein
MRTLMQTVEFVHRGCRLCEADEDHTNEHARSASPHARTRKRERGIGSGEAEHTGAFERDVEFGEVEGIGQAATG